jgi:hypothetical protein
MTIDFWICLAALAVVVGALLKETKGASTCRPKTRQTESL